LIVDVNNIDTLDNKNLTICSGWFDLFHIGHLNFLKNAKAQGNRLCVIVMNDNDGKVIKGNNRPIINEYQRLEIIDSIKYVDYTILSQDILHQDNILNLQGKDLLLWQRYIPIIKRIHPDKVFSLEETLKNNGLGDYIENELHIKVVYSDRYNGISTTEIERKLAVL